MTRLLRPMAMTDETEGTTWRGRFEWQVVAGALVVALLLTTACHPPIGEEPPANQPPSTDTEAQDGPRIIAVANFDELIALDDPSLIDLGQASLLAAVQAGYATPEDYEVGMTELDTLTAELMAEIDRDDTPRQRSREVVHFMGRMGFTSDASDELGHNPDNLFMHRVLARRRGYCLSLSLVALTLSQRVGGELSGVRLPNHFFVRSGAYGDYLPKPRNYEMTAQGAEVNDGTFFDRYNLEANAVGHGVYLTNLTPLETLGDLCNNIGATFLLRAGEPESESFDADLVRQGVGWFRRGLTLNTSNPQLHYNLGLGWLRLGELPSAIANFSAALHLDSRHYQALCDRGQLYCNHGDPEAGLSDLRRAIDVWPDRPKAYLIRAVYLARAGEIDRAEESFDEALRRAPHDAEVQYNVIVYRLRMLARGHRPGLIELMEMYLREHPNHVGADVIAEWLARLRAERQAHPEWFRE